MSYLNEYRKEILENERESMFEIFEDSDRIRFTSININENKDIVIIGTLECPHSQNKDNYIQIISEPDLILTLAKVNRELKEIKAWLTNFSDCECECE